MRRYDLEDRLNRINDNVIKYTNSFPNNFTTQNFITKLIRLICSVSINYDEAKRAETTSDYIYKVTICLNNLNESALLLKILIENKIIDRATSRLFIKEIEELGASLLKNKQIAIKRQLMQ